MIHSLKKPVLCLFATLMILFSASIGYADGIDLSPMSDAEIIAMLTQVNAEIVARGIRKTATLSKGSYIAGKDIPVGSYVFTCLATGDDWGNVTVRSEEGKGEQLIWEIVSAPEKGAEPETIFIKLNKGDQLKSGVSFSLTVNSGILFE